MVIPTQELCKPRTPETQGPFIRVYTPFRFPFRVRIKSTNPERRLLPSNYTLTYIQLSYPRNNSLTLTQGRVRVPFNIFLIFKFSGVLPSNRKRSDHTYHISFYPTRILHLSSSCPVWLALSLRHCSIDRIINGRANRLYDYSDCTTSLGFSYVTEQR